eukprot:CAMPEP_0170553236 /NCGR_PEP_ID=MMETSP0211-20121228/11039_1 /TAXON_ID=311385 /ORGANISM="Pseudokeronopsis sp., Strain OXSARD2" /LENGTH=59 /DNA_ID=CAMNT_0010861413 /DNA_START=248 /DNA_END=424 /DNA_ORIENTATION=+
MLSDFLEPLHHIDEGLFTSDIIGQEDAMGTTVEDPSDRHEGLLPSSVPDLQFHYLIIQL